MVALNLIFMTVRFFLRLRMQGGKLRLSDYLILLAMALIIATAIQTTMVNMYEINFLEAHPNISRKQDLVTSVTGYSAAEKATYAKVC